MTAEKTREMWDALGVPQVDLSKNPDHLVADILRNGGPLAAVRAWAKKHNKRKTPSHSCTYRLKHGLAAQIGQWVPHSVLPLALYLGGIQFYNWRPEGGAGVFQTNLGRVLNQ